ncbi:hypothetical protein [Microbacterium sp. EST19A]|uniref:hypothetical protein n=1 Tax=Microbacterium sp. EST19A TaxID=2862681 RepID=UPI001CBF3410|nr:hypothetical protein [Microbacterium sp. EST19A]
MSAYEERGARHEGFADRLIEVYMHRAGAEDTGLILDEFQDTSDDIVRDLAELVVTLAFKAANPLTVYDITDPERRVVPEKIDRLRKQIEDATARWLKELEAANG